MIILAGPNGAGKTTAAQVLLPESLGIREFVNADNIAAGLSPFSPEAAAFEAGRIMLARVRSLIERRESFCFETTLSGRTYVRHVETARATGYFIHLIYVRLRSAELSLERIADRVRKGGHDIPEDAARRRFDRSRHNFFALYRLLADSWLLCDNSGGEIKLVARGLRDQPAEIIDPVLLEIIQRDVPPRFQIR